MEEHESTPHPESLIVSACRAAELKAASQDWPSWDLTPRQECDLELLLNGAYSPLGGFMGRADCESVLARMELASGALWPVPIVLDITSAMKEKLEVGSSLVLRDAEGVMLAVLEISDLWKADGNVPGIVGDWLAGGKIQGFQLPQHYDHRDLRLTPAQVREVLSTPQWVEAAAYPAATPLHRAEMDRIRDVWQERPFQLLLHGQAGATTPGDTGLYTRVRCYRHALARLPEMRSTLALVPLTKRDRGPANALLQALVARNFGCSKIFAANEEESEFLVSMERRSGVKTIPFRPPGATKIRPSLADDQLERCLEEGTAMPEGFTWPEIEAELRKAHPPRSKQGFTVFFTGLSGSGKSTISRLVLSRLLEIGGRSVTLLDGDLVRKNLSSELGFSREHRILNVLRIGYVASEITKNGGAAICAPIAPYASTRKELRRLISAQGGFILCHVATPLEVCEARDRKGLYAKARAGIIPEFTGVSDPYEEPDDAEIVLQTENATPEDCAGQVISYLRQLGYLSLEA